jgi:hypothetical protein
MPEPEWEQLLRMTHASVQDENGIDVTQIDYLLSLSPTERLAQLEQEIANDAVLCEASIKNYGFDPRAAVEADLERR